MVIPLSITTALSGREGHNPRIKVLFHSRSYGVVTSDVKIAVTINVCYSMAANSMNLKGSGLDLFIDFCR